MKGFFKNRPWKKWRTRKITFIGVLLVWLLLVGLDVAGVELNDLIIEKVFDKGAWVITTGTLLVLTGTGGKDEDV